MSHLAPAPMFLPPRKPMASARRVSLFEREIQVSLSAAAVDILFELASLLSEGEWKDGGYFGSTMITIDLGRATGLVSDPCDAATAHRVAQLLARDPRVRQRACRVAEEEANRLADRPVGRVQFDLGIRMSGCNLHIDVDVEAGSGPAETARPVGAGRSSTREVLA